MWLMLAMMLITASMELPAASWVPPVIESGGEIPGILIFAYLFGVMGTLRLLAGPVEKKLKPTGILFYGAILATAGLFTFSYAESVPMLFVTATLWAVGIAYFWPNMIGFVADKIPKSGALGMSIIGAVGMFSTSIFQPIIGNWIDTDKAAAEASGLTGDELELVAGQNTLETMTTFPAILIVLFTILWFWMRKRKTDTVDAAT